MAKYLIDTNVWSRILKGDTNLRRYVETLDYAIDTTVYVELIQGSKNKAEVAGIEKIIGKLQLIHFDKRISRKTIDLIRQYAKSHGLILPDAIIAAVCIEEGLELVTFNIRDFHFIDGLSVKAPNY